MSQRFAGRRVFVTGASRGIGRAIAEAFRAEGAQVIGTRTDARGPEDDVCQEWVVADFTIHEQLAACADAVRRVEPDVVVNNAGINKVAPFLEISEDDFLRIQRVNVFAPFVLCQAAIPAMKRKGWGRIVNVSSIWGKISKAGRVSYSASKFALDGLTIALSAEHAQHGILANSVAPGFVDTDLTRRILSATEIDALTSMVPVRRLGGVDEVARLVLWLASEENTYLTGQNIAVDGGFTRV